MGLYRNGIKIAKPYQAGNKANAYMEGYKLWADDIPPLFFTSASDFSVTPKIFNLGKTIDYSFDSTTWTQWDGSSQIDVPAGEKIYFKSDTEDSLFVIDDFNNRWVLTGSNIEAGGNIQSLLNYSDTVPEYGFFAMFQNNVNIITAPKLLATILSTWCYAFMFQGCASLTSAPDLPATNLADGCYDSMFNNCASLTTAPALMSTSLVNGCYAYMFGHDVNLNYVKVGFTSWGNYTNNWLVNVSSNGTFVKPSALPEDFGPNRIPTNWTIVNQ